MERFAFIAAVTIAILFGLGAYVSRTNQWHFSMADAVGMEPVVPAQAGHLSQSYVAGSVDIRHAAAFIVVTPEDRQDVALEITNPGSAPMPTIELRQGNLLIDGHLRGRVERCLDEGGARLRGYGDMTRDQLPQIVLHVPRNANISTGGGNTTEIAAAESLSGDFSGCGSTTIADVAGNLDIDLSGAGNVTAGTSTALTADISGTGSLDAGATQRVNLDISGTGRASLGEVAESAEADISGTGSLTLASLTGTLDYESSGTGSLNIGAGQLTTASLDLSGAGHASINAPVRDLTVEASGVGNIDVNAPVVNLNAEISGPSHVRVQAVTGNLTKEVNGPGSVTVGP